MKKITKVLVMAGILASLTGCTIGNTKYVLDWKNVVHKNSVFSINKTECSEKEAKLYLCNYQNIYGDVYGVNLWEHDFEGISEDETLETYVKDVTLSELANILCMNLLAEEQGIELTEAEEELVREAAAEYYESLSEAEVDYMGVDKVDVFASYKKYATAQKLYNSLTQGVKEEVSEDEARVIRVQQIYVTNKDEAQKVEKKLQDGDDFASVASNYNKADMIEITLKRGDFPSEVDDIVFNLDNEEQSGMMETENGYYFMRCLSKYEEALTEENKENILAQRRKEQFDDVFRTFVENSEFDMNDELWDSIEIDTSGSIVTDSFFAVYDKYFE